MSISEGGANGDKSSLLPLISAVFVTILVLTPSASSKLIAIGPFNIVGSTLFFPISYIFGDVLTEVYGYRRSRRIIWIGFGCQIFAAAAYGLIDIWPAAPFWDEQEAYSTILGQAPRIVLASITAYFVGEFANSYIVSRLKHRAGGKAGPAMAGRFFLSTVVGEFFDSFVFIIVAFAGTMATSDMLMTGATIWVLKTLYEAVALPFSMKFVTWIKEREGIDIIDDPARVKYSPFHF